MIPPILDLPFILDLPLVPLLHPHGSNRLTKHLCALRQALRERPKRPLKDLYPEATSGAIAMLENLLLFDPDKRLTVEQCLAHQFLETLHDPGVLPCPAARHIPPQLSMLWRGMKELCAVLLIESCRVT